MRSKEEILKKHTEDSQWYPPVCDARIYKAMDEYANELIKENYVEKEFFEWAIDEQEVFCGELTEKYIINDNPKTFKTFDELHTYWKQLKEKEK
jgi:hypothetical protein